MSSLRCENIPATSAILPSLFLANKTNFKLVKTQAYARTYIDLLLFPLAGFAEIAEQLTRLLFEAICT